MLQLIKDWLVQQGPTSPVTQAALQLHGAAYGFSIRFNPSYVSLRRGSKEMRLGLASFCLIPIMLECFARFFEEVEAAQDQGRELLDFSTPAYHRYRQHKISLKFPHIAEDDGIAAYTHRYRPQPGDCVFDVGAHAGLTTCVFARMVGPAGSVFAFEPDAGSRAYLQENIRSFGLRNVTVVDMAMDALSGEAAFNADGTMGAALVSSAVYTGPGSLVQVKTISIQDAVNEFGLPKFIKLDIEGAEVGVVGAGEKFFEENAVELTFDSYHRLRDGRFSWTLLEPMLKAYGYQVESSAEFGQMFTWAWKS